MDQRGSNWKASIRPKTPSKELFQKIYNLNGVMARHMYSDQTERFPTKLYKGKQYIMVLVELASDAILVEAPRDSTSWELIQDYQVLVH